MELRAHRKARWLRAVGSTGLVERSRFAEAFGWEEFRELVLSHGFHSDLWLRISKAKPKRRNGTGFTGSTGL